MKLSPHRALCRAKRFLIWGQLQNEADASGRPTPILRQGDRGAQEGLISGFADQGDFSVVNQGPLGTQGDILCFHSVKWEWPPCCLELGDFISEFLFL